MNLIYLRCRRVSSSATGSLLSKLEDMKYIDKVHTPTHRPAGVVKRKTESLYGKNFWSNAHKTVTIRNPFDNAVSIFLHKKIVVHPNEQIPVKKLKELKVKFKEEVKIVFDKVQKTPKRSYNSRWADWQWSLYTKHNKPVVDDFIFYETPRDSFNKILKKFNIQDPEVDHLIDNFVKTYNMTRSKYDYREFYDNDTRDKIYQLRKREIDFFKYKFR
jgi:hypothetical protein